MLRRLNLTNVCGPAGRGGGDSGGGSGSGQGTEHSKERDINKAGLLASRA